MERKTYTVLDYAEFEDLVNENIPAAAGEYEFAPSEEADNDSSYEFNDIGKDYNSPFFQSHVLPDVEKGNLQYRAYALFEILVHQGILEPGDYLVNVSW